MGVFMIKFFAFLIFFVSGCVGVYLGEMIIGLALLGAAVLIPAT